jgi:hypothetical protein
MQIRHEEIKILIFADDMLAYIEDLKKYPPNIIEPIKVVEYEVNMKKINELHFNTSALENINLK